MVILMVLIGAVCIPLTAWLLVGTRRHRDPWLVPSLILALAFTLGGLAELLTADAGLDWKLTFGALAFFAFAIRWRRASALRPPRL